MPSKDECKRILSKLGFKLGVSPALIAKRLLSDEDKQDMLDDLIPINSLECAIQAWMENKMPDYANGKTEPFREFYS